MFVAPDLSDVPPERQLRYGDIRSHVDDGDVMLFRGTLLLSRMIERLSHGAYSHCAIAANWRERKMILQAQIVGGVQAVPLSVAVGATSLTVSVVATEVRKPAATAEVG